MTLSAGGNVRVAEAILLPASVQRGRENPSFKDSLFFAFFIAIEKRETKFHKLNGKRGRHIGLSLLSSV